MKASTHSLRTIAEHLTHVLTICSYALTDLIAREDENEKSTLHSTAAHLQKILKTCIDALADLVYPPDEDEPE